MNISEKLVTIAENEGKVFQAGYGRGCYDIGYDTGKWDGYDEGLKQGKSEGVHVQYDEFWNFFQQEGTGTNYSFAFCGKGWNDNTFKPKYPIIPVGSVHSMFRNSAIGDLEALLQKCGSYLDTSKITTLDTAFAGSTITHIGKIDTTKMSKLQNAFSGASKLETIDELCLNDPGLPTPNMNANYESHQTFNNTFTNCNALKNITISGKIFRDINLQWSTLLTPKSMKSIILHLYYYRTNAHKYTVTFAEECWTALEADSKSPSGTTWREYVDSLGWLT